MVLGTRRWLAWDRHGNEMRWVKNVVGKVKWEYIKREREKELCSANYYHKIYENEWIKIYLIYDLFNMK